MSPEVSTGPGRRVSRRARAGLDPHQAGFCLAVVIVLVTAVHVLLVAGNQGPWVFYDELGYQKLAQSLGETGRLALFGKQGLSDSPLYPLVLSPLYALHLSATAAYEWTKIVNCVSMSLAIVPIYKIARFVLAPGPRSWRPRCRRSRR